MASENGRRVVITGMGAVTPLGNDAETFWENLTAGKGKQNVATIVKQQSKTIVIEEVGTLAAPATGTVALAGGGAA